MSRLNTLVSDLRGKAQQYLTRPEIVSVVTARMDQIMDLMPRQGHHQHQQQQQQYSSQAQAHSRYPRGGPEERYQHAASTNAAVNVTSGRRNQSKERGGGGGGREGGRGRTKRRDKSSSPTRSADAGRSTSPNTAATSQSPGRFEVRMRASGGRFDSRGVSLEAPDWASGSHGGESGDPSIGGLGAPSPGAAEVDEHSLVSFGSQSLPQLGQVSGNGLF